MVLNLDKYSISSKEAETKEENHITIKRVPKGRIASIH